MADRGGLSLAARVRWRLTPWWGRVLFVYVASRLVTGGILLAMAFVEAQLNSGPVPDAFTFAANWDGQWYWRIALGGYPTVLPLDAEGHVAQNAWAFMPVYPFLASVFVHLGFPFPLIAPVISLVAGAGAALLFHQLLRESGLQPGSALFGVVLLCTAPLSPMFQVSYAESLGLALLFLALLLVQRRRFWLLLPVVVLMSLTRPSGLAFALFLLLYFVLRIVQAVRRRDEHPLPRRETAGIVTAGLVSFASGMSWPAIAWAVTGSPTAYTDTELAWRAGYVGRGAFEPFVDWFHGVAFWLAYFTRIPTEVAGPLAAIGTGLVVALFAVFLFTPWAKRLGVEVRLWLVSYLVYLLAVFFPQSSTWRLLLPLAPALGAFAVPRSTALRVSLVLLGVAGQLLWVYGCWVQMPGDWSPP